MFYICLSRNSNGQGLRDWFGQEEQITFLNRKDCCARFNFQDSDDNIKTIEAIISKAPTHSVLLFDEVPLSSKIEQGRPSYDWSTLRNRRPNEVTAVVCLQPIRLAVTYLPKSLKIKGPQDADSIELTNQYRSSKNIMQFVNRLCQHELPIEYANVDVSPSHDVKGPEITAISISDLNQTSHLKVWLCNQLQEMLACKPYQAKMIYLSSTKKLAESVTLGTVYNNSLTSIDDFQGCETPVAHILKAKTLADFAFLPLKNLSKKCINLCNKFCDISA